MEYESLPAIDSVSYTHLEALNAGKKRIAESISATDTEIDPSELQGAFDVMENALREDVYKRQGHNQLLGPHEGHGNGGCDA